MLHREGVLAIKARFCLQNTTQRCGDFTAKQRLDLEAIRQNMLPSQPNFNNSQKSMYYSMERFSIRKRSVQSIGSLTIRFNPWYIYMLFKLNFWTWRTGCFIHSVKSASLTNSYICICFYKLVSIKRHFSVVQIATMGFKRNDVC